MATKTISVSPEFFGNKVKKKSKTRKKHKIRDNINILQKNFLKEQMIDKIKKFKKKKQKQHNKDNTYKTDYNEAVEFMENVIKKNKTRKQRKRERKQKKIEAKRLAAAVQQQQSQATKISNKLYNPSQQLNSTSNQSQQNLKIETPPLSPVGYTSLKPDPPYGILKNGNKPTFSNYRKARTMPKSPIVITNPATFGVEVDVNNELTKFKTAFTDSPSTNSKDIPVLNGINRQTKLEKLKNKLKANNSKEVPDKFLVKNKKIIKRFKLGKNKKTHKVSILINNKKTRRLIKKDQIKLKKNKLSKIKKYLSDKSLIKQGTSAPNEMLREMYLNCYLSGDIKNSGGKNAEEILMHNWNT